MAIKKAAAVWPEGKLLEIIETSGEIPFNTSKGRAERKKNCKVSVTITVERITDKAPSDIFAKRRRDDLETIARTTYPAARK